MQRVVEPELLDTLPADHPAARRSRRDLHLLNALMGNERWLVRQVRKHPAAARRGVVEVGAGDGCLAARLARWFPVSAVDLAPRPAGLASPVGWRQGDWFDCHGGIDGALLVANLFVHHFEGRRLAAFGESCRRFEVLCCCEPWRAAWVAALGRMLHPWLAPVTRHDMQVSIRAGFRRGELPRMLGLDSAGWHWRESVDVRGSLRLVARKAGCGR